ncbi:Lipin/Ned1/Smp2-domain-containing protein [Flammula alnicola]|nr:Lipin/Ned1/Smp2-domain-containing protein [Flammula alnicola]
MTVVWNITVFLSLLFYQDELYSRRLLQELPPINPSTLTGAIDVIVIQRPTDDGDTELVCSPFHVRFGKWQVLRPGEKKVNVSVNGNPIPFSMKIGEAGEAFFVFETEDDVPADLITSPILQPTIPGQEPPKQLDEKAVDTDHFGAKQDEDKEQQEQAGAELKPDEDRLEAPATPKQTQHVPKYLRKSGSKATLNQSSLPSPPPSRDHSIERSRTPEMDQQDLRVDAALEALRAEAHIPKSNTIMVCIIPFRNHVVCDLIIYHADITLDMEGYKSGYHDRERSDQTVRSSQEQVEFPRQEPSQEQHSPSFHIPNPRCILHMYRSTSPTTPPSHPYPFRATSEPPPDMEIENDTSQVLTMPAPHNGHSNSQLQLQIPVEYSWEWGAFPQPSPMKASFGKGGRVEPPKGLWGSSSGSKKNRPSERKSRLMGMQLPPAINSSKSTEEEDGYEQSNAGGSGFPGRSKSVPPHFLGSPARKGRRGSREYKEYEDVDGHDQEEEERGRTGGILSASQDDLTTFVLRIEGKTDVEEETRKGTTPSNPKLKSKTEKVRDEVEAARLFDSNCIDWSRFLDDENVVHDPRLVIRWAANQYITKHDGSPLMDALVHWRSSALSERALGEPLRLVSHPPLPMSGHGRLKSEAEALQDDDKKRAEKEVVGEAQGPAAMKKPTSSSWVAWWSRSRRIDANGNDGKAYPILDSTGSEPATPVLAPAHGIVTPPSSQRGTGKQDTTPTRPTVPAPAPAKKYAKTLRLTSDQLKLLNLKPGANAITFSLSASGAIAATARIFVWNSTDLAVVSDIDGTITKSDGLGHVFAMIGRDWTHLGVAKLYTDIARNGYKIMYLTSRAIGQADATRDYLKGIKQNNYQLPEGPVIMSPDRLMASLHREVIMRKPEVFKMACLRDIQRLFGESARNPFYAGFGNRITDALSYRSVNVPSARIFTIDTAGEVKMELLELAGYKSSYIHMTDLVDQMFPPIHRKWTPEFTDFNYWKTPVQDFPLPDLSPPSPALSARSDTSNQSALARLRNFSLGGNANTASRQHAIRQSSISSTTDGQVTMDGSPYRDSHLRQMSSFEKLSSTLGFMSRMNGEDASWRSTSPSSSSSYIGSDDEDDDGEISPDGQRRRRVRRRSMTSMPGTLDERHFGMDDDEEEEEGHDHLHHDDGQFVHGEEDDNYDGEGDEGDADEQADEAFDDDLLAAGEMQNVPFL